MQQLLKARVVLRSTTVSCRIEIKGSSANRLETAKEQRKDSLRAFTFCWRHRRFLPMGIGGPCRLALGHLLLDLWST